MSDGRLISCPNMSWHGVKLVISGQQCDEPGGQTEDAHPKTLGGHWHRFGVW